MRLLSAWLRLASGLLTTRAQQLAFAEHHHHRPINTCRLARLATPTACSGTSAGRHLSRDASIHGMQWRQWIWTYLWSDVYDVILYVRLFTITWTTMMVVNALIVWKKLIDICFLIKSSLLVLTAAYTKFRIMIWSMIWSCGHRSRSRCVLLPHRHAGRLHWGKSRKHTSLWFPDASSHYIKIWLI